MKHLHAVPTFSTTIGAHMLRFQLAPQSHLLQRLHEGFPARVYQFYGIESAEWDAFVAVHERHWASAVARLDACKTKKELEMWEQAVGIRRDADSLMWDAAACWALPPSRE